jgi:hypothetical protein
MTVRRKLWLCAALAAAPLSLAAGWCWNRSCDPEYVASACVSAPVSLIASSLDTFEKSDVEESFLSPEVVTAASELLQERAASDPHAATLDSEIDTFLNRLDVSHERDGDRADIELRYRTTDARQAVAVLTAVVDAGVRSLQSLAPEVADFTTDDRHRESVQLAQALEQQQARVSELQARVASRDRESPESPHSPARLRTLDLELQQAREHRIEAEDQLAIACQEVRAGVSVEQIVARLPEGSAWSATRDVAGAIRLKDELRQLESAFETAAKVYGRNHPRMLGLKTQIDQTGQQLASQAGLIANSSVVQASSTESDAHPQASPPATAVLLLTALEEKCRQVTLAEQVLERQLASATALREEQQALDPQLADARQELDFLQKEHDRVRREIAATRREAESRRVNITESPTLLAEPIAPSLPQHLLWAGLAGTIVSGGFLRGFLRSPTRATSTTGTSQGLRIHDQFRSHEEDNLARLRRLKPVA